MNVLKMQHGLFVIYLTHGSGGTVLLFNIRSAIYGFEAYHNSYHYCCK